MPDFAYRAKTRDGTYAEGTIAAESHREALSLLSGKALFPLEVRNQTAGDLGQLSILKFSRRVKTEDVADLLTQMSDLLTNGVSLLETLRLLAEQSTDPTLGDVMKQVHDDVADGVNLDVAMESHPKVFSKLTISMVRAGLEGAFLEDALERVSGFLRRQDELRGKVTGAMTYPMILAGVGLSITIGLVIFIVPMFESFFERLERSGVGLPWITILLLAISHGLVRYGLILVGLVVAAVVGYKKWLATPTGSRLADKWKLKIPLVGPIYLDTAVSRFCRVLGTLLRNGVPILKSLEISSASTGNQLLCEAIRESADNISSGNLLSKPLSASGLIPPQVMAMIRIAEESNTLDQVLLNVSDRMDQKIERKLDMMVRLIEPLMLLTIGAMVMFIIIGVLLPVFDINSAVD